MTRVGIFVQNNSCINGKTNIKWEAKVVNNTEDAILSLYPYCYKKGKPIKMTSTNIAPGPFLISQSEIKICSHYKFAKRIYMDLYK